MAKVLELHSCASAKNDLATNSKAIAIDVRCVDYMSQYKFNSHCSREGMATLISMCNRCLLRETWTKLQ